MRETFEAAALTEEDLFKQDLDAGYLDRYLRAQDPARPRGSPTSWTAGPRRRFRCCRACGGSASTSRARQFSTPSAR